MVNTKIATLSPIDPGTLEGIVSSSPATNNQPSQSLVDTDDQIWETKLAATPTHVVENLAAKVRADIAAGKTRPFKSTKHK